jgi:hypothetical protein
MQGFVQGADRQQTTLPPCLDDWIDESNSIRAVDVFVEALDLRDLGFATAVPIVNSICWRLIENRAMLLLDVGFVQTDLWNGDRPAAVASCA